MGLGVYLHQPAVPEIRTKPSRVFDRFKLDFFFGHLGKLQMLLFQLCWLLWKLRSIPLQIWENFIAASLGFWEQTSARKCVCATYFAAFQATFSPSFSRAGDQLFPAPQPVFACFTTAALLWSRGCLSPLTMRRAKVWQRWRTCCLNHVCRLGTGKRTRFQPHVYLVTLRYMWYTFKCICVLSDTQEWGPWIQQCHGADTVVERSVLRSKPSIELCFVNSKPQTSRALQQVLVYKQRNTHKLQDKTTMNYLAGQHRKRAAAGQMCSSRTKQGSWHKITFLINIFSRMTLLLFDSQNWLEEKFKNKDMRWERNLASVDLSI